jgi:hypothetical protein
MRIPNPFNRKSAVERLFDALDDSLNAAGDVTSSLPSRVRSDKAKVGLIAAGSLAGLTAASAGVSSLRRRLEGPRDDS